MEGTGFHIGFRLLGVLALVFANGFFVAAEFAFVTIRKTRVDQLIAEGNRAACVVRTALSDPNSYIASTQLGITMASLGLGWIGEPALASLLQPIFGFLPPRVSVATEHSVAVALAFAIITSLHIVLGELAPKTVALQHAERTALVVVRPTLVFRLVFWPFIALLNRMGRAVVNVFGLKAPSGHSMVHSEEELKMLVTASQEAGVLEEDEEQMLHRVFGFADLTAGRVMIPRTEMVAIEAGADLRQVLELVQRSPANEIPVYREDIDDIVGFLLVKDLVPALAAPPSSFTVSALVREALTVPETMRADDLLAEMRRRRTRQAIVIDEYGGTAGLVTFQGLMERIVGDLGGETLADRRIVRQPDGSAILDGLALVADVNEQFGLHIDEDTYNTVGGYMLGRLGRRPREGDTIEIEGRAMRVDRLDGLRVARVWLSGPSIG